MSEDHGTANELAARSKRFGWVWYAYFVVLVAMLVINIHLRGVESTATQRRDQQRQLITQHVLQTERLKGLVSQVSAIASQQAKEIRELKKMFRKVQSRDQFLVTQGDRIVWSRHLSNPRGVRAMGFYVPAGKHRLVYSVNQFLGETYYARSAKITGGDHRALPESGFVELVGKSVYELRVAVEKSEAQTVNVSLLGEDNAKVHDKTYRLAYPARVSLTNLQNDSEKFISFPSELRSAGDAKAHVSAKKSAPVVGIMTLMLDDLGGRGKESKGRVVMRFWIDSESGGCMAATNVATKYKFLSNMKQAFKPATQKDFEQTFKPYDGSGRYFFRDGYFPPPTPVEGIDTID